MASIKKYDTAKGKAWRVQYRSPDGKSRTKQEFRTKDEAQSWADKNATQIRNQDWIAPEKNATHVEELWERWWKSRQPQLAPSSQKALTTSWNVHVKPQWGNIAVGAVTTVQVQDWVDDLSTRRGASVVHRAVEILRGLMGDAVRFGMIRTNPTRDLRLPPRAKKKQTTLTEKQLNLLVEKADRFKSLLLFLGYTGSRWGEATALTVGDIDIKKQRATINKSVWRSKGKEIIGETKTHETRVIGVPKKVLEAMKPDLKGKLPTARIWANRDGSHVSTPSRRSWFHSALDKAKAEDDTFPDISPHDLRHACASMLISRGASVLVVQRQLGHASAKMTLDKYAHLFEDDLDSVIRAVGD